MAAAARFDGRGLCVPAAVRFADARHVCLRRLVSLMLLRAVRLSAAVLSERNDFEGELLWRIRM